MPKPGTTAQRLRRGMIRFSQNQPREEGVFQTPLKVAGSDLPHKNWSKLKVRIQASKIRNWKKGLCQKTLYPVLNNFIMLIRV